MNELIPILFADVGGEQIQTCNARELHSFLDVGKDFSTWIKDRIKKYDFIEGVDFAKIDSPVSGNQRGGDRRSIEYYISLSMAKELSMVERNAKGKEARLYFIECERVAKEATSFALPDFTNPAIAAREWAKQYELRQALEHKVKQDAPKIDFAEAVTASDAEHTITEAAKVLSIRPRKFFDWLRANGFIYKQGTQAMQFSINKGLMVTRFHTFKHTDGELDKKAHARITGKELYFFYQRLRHEGLIERNPNLELTA